MQHLRLSLCLLGCVAALAQTDVLTGGYGNDRTNANTAETILTTDNVKADSFGRLFAVDADGQIFAQPLYAHQITIDGKGNRNVVFVATMHNSVYAWDADAPGDPLWMVNLGPSASTKTIGFNDLNPEVGILGTPVIDRATHTLYVVAETFENGQYFHKLHALDLANGKEKFNGPAIIAGSVSGTGAGSQKGTLTFDSVLHLQRPALLLLNGAVYVAFGSHADQGNYHGWLFGYNASNVQQQTGIFCTSPDQVQGAIWQAGRGPASDGTYIYVATGNGPWDGKSTFGQSFLKLDPAHNLALADWFTTANWQATAAVDDDFGSSGAAIIPGTSYLIGGDKGGYVYIADKTNLGNLTNNDIGLRDKSMVVGYGIFTFALWNNYFFTQAENDSLKAFSIAGGRVVQAPSSMSTSQHVSAYAGYSVSSNGVNAGTGIVWAVTCEVKHASSSPGTVRALDATNLGTELWNSDMVADRDTLGWFSKFANPTVANGKVYVPTASNRLVVYGLLPSTGISGVASAASFENGPVAPGEIVTLFGSGLGPSTMATTQVNNDGTVKTQLSDAEVLFDGVASPLIFINATRAAAVVPAEVAGHQTTSVQVQYNGSLSAPFIVPVADTAPALFSLAESGVGPAAALNADLSVNSADNPAARGTIVVLYGTGEGLTTPSQPDNVLTPLQPPFPAATQPFAVAIGGQPAQIVYAGPTPGFLGLVQINAVVPTNIPAGAAVPVEVTIGGRAGASGVTIAVK